MQGAPSFVRMYQYPRLEGAGSVLASRSFYRADDVKFTWNRKGLSLMFDLSKSDMLYIQYVHVRHHMHYVLKYIYV